MILPDRCPFARLSAGDLLHTTPQGTPCCRVRDEPLCLSMGREPTVYRFRWDSSFDGNAMVRISRQGENIMLRWRYWRAYHELTGEVVVLPADWASLEARIDAASFWSLAARDDCCMGLDGATWTIEARRGRDYHRIERWSPRDEIAALGRLFFDLAGPPLSAVRL